MIPIEIMLRWPAFSFLLLIFMIFYLVAQRHLRRIGEHRKHLFLGLFASGFVLTILLAYYLYGWRFLLSVSIPSWIIYSGIVYFVYQASQKIRIKSVLLPVFFMTVLSVYVASATYSVYGAIQKKSHCMSVLPDSFFDSFYAYIFCILFGAG